MTLPWTEETLLRRVEIGTTGYQLITWDADPPATSTYRIGYRLVDCSGRIVFEEELERRAEHPYGAIDSTAVLRDIVAKIYSHIFDSQINLTEDQKTFLMLDAEKLSSWRDDDADYPFYDLDELYRGAEALANHCYRIACQKGFHDDATSVGDFCSNLHGEVSELWEAYRNHALGKECDKGEKMRAAGTTVLTCAEEELADIQIRCLDTAKALGVNMARALEGKSAFNETRPHRHGGKKA